MTGNASTVYLQVIDDVIGKVRDDFISLGAGDAVLSELQALWEMKMMQCGAISGNIERPSVLKSAGQINPVHDLNVPYEGPTEEYETPTADMLFPPTPLQTQTPTAEMLFPPTPVQPQTPMQPQTPTVEMLFPPTPLQTPLRTPMDQSNYNIPTGPSDSAPSPISDMRNSTQLKSGRPPPYMQPPSSWMNQRSLGVDVNVAYVEGREDGERGASYQQTRQDLISSGKRKRGDLNPPSHSYMPQRDGNDDAIVELPMTKMTQVLPQSDGVDEYDELFHFQGGTTEDYNASHDHQIRTPAAASTPRQARNDGEDDDDEPPLNEDDDDDDLDELEHGEEQPIAQDLVLAQFDKVSRTKNRWKCILKNGIMHLGGKDILFNKATGEFDF